MKYIIKVISNIELSSSFIEILERKNINDYTKIFETKFIDLLLNFEIITNKNQLYIIDQNDDINKILSLKIRDIIEMDINDENEIKKYDKDYRLTNFKTSFQQELIGSCKEQKEKIKEIIISLLKNNQIFEFKENHRINKGSISTLTIKKKILDIKKITKKDLTYNYGDERIKIIRKCFLSCGNVLNNLYKKYDNENKDYQKLHIAYPNQIIIQNNFENYRNFCKLKLYEAFSNCYPKNVKKEEAINKKTDNHNKIAFNYIIEKEKDIKEKSILYLLLKETDFKTILNAFLDEQDEITILNRTFPLEGFVTFNHYFNDYTNKIRDVLKKDMKCILEGKESYKAKAQKNEYLCKKRKNDEKKK